VISKNNEKIVRLLKTTEEGGKMVEKIEEIKVEVGIRGSNGKTEIISGINEGDKVIVFIKNEK